MNTCAKLILPEQATNTGDFCLSVVAVVPQNQVITEDLGVQKILRNFSLAGNRMNAECPMPNNHISVICDSAPSLSPPRSQVVVEIIVVYIDNLLKKYFWSSGL